MIKSQIKVGDLVHVPSEVLLFNESTTHKVKQPINLLITGQKDGNYEVLFDGGSWYVSQNSVYKMREKNAKIY